MGTYQEERFKKVVKDATIETSVEFTGQMAGRSLANALGMPESTVAGMGKLGSKLLKQMAGIEDRNSHL